MQLRALPVLAVTLVPAVARGAEGFLEPDVVVLHTLSADEGSFGWAVAELGDLDGDGAREALTGAPFHSAGGMNAGRVFVYASGSGEQLFEWTGEAGDALGYAIADAGDIDGDGKADIVAGAPGLMGAIGRVLVYSGADGSVLHEIAGDVAGGRLGAAVAGAGDLDGDGVPDLLLGAEAHPAAGLKAGRVIAVSGATAAILWTRDGEGASNFMGSGAAALGDVDGDGTPDVVVGARGAGPAGHGRVYVLSGVDGGDVYPPREADASGGNLGHFFVAGVGDLDGDGVPEVYGGDYSDNANGEASGKAYVWSGKTGAILWSFTGEHAGDGLGCGRRGGDADGDGVPDLAIGSYNASPRGAASAGRVTVFSGATGAVLRTISGANPGYQLGFDVVSLGDVDGDARPDLLMSAASGNTMYIVAGASTSEGGSTGEPGTTDATTGDATTGDATTGDVTTTGAMTGATTGASTGADATTGPSSDTGGSSESGCGCRGGGSPGGLMLFAWLAVRRRRRPTDGATAAR